MIDDKEIAAWHREQAKRHELLAKQHRNMAEILDGIGLSNVLRPARSSGGDDGPSKTLTLEQFESALAEKGGRVNHLAARLQVAEDTIWDLLKDPNCKYIVGDRGFIYPKPLS